MDDRKIETEFLFKTIVIIGVVTLAMMLALLPAILIYPQLEFMMAGLALLACYIITPILVVIVVRMIIFDDC